ncbi:MAG TPA: hypothetical protein VHP30_15515, partial [Ignavibacteriales bacterium]|nr:hypothetical protein [Ignavibacteriales bacterium]
MRSLLRPMGIREILDSTFTIMRERFWTFQGVIFLAFLPATLFFLMIGGLIAAIIYKISFSQGLSSLSDHRIWSELLSASGIITLIFLLLLGALFIIAAIAGSIFFQHGTINLFKHGLHGEKCKVREAFNGLKKKWLWYFLYYILIQIAMMIITVPFSIGSATISFLNLPLLNFGIQILIMLLQMTVMFFFCLTPVIIAVEDVDIIKALIRSFQLPAKHRLRMLGTLIALYLLMIGFYAIIIGLLIPSIAMISNMVNLFTILFLVFSILLVLLVISGMIPFVYGPVTAIYYDFVIRKEGYDIQLQMES